MSVRRTLFFDLDGTLLDNSERYYRLYRDGIATMADEPLDRSTYWSMKRRAMPERSILAESGFRGDPASYIETRLSRIEDAAYLDLDTLQSGAREALNELSSRYHLVLVTHRCHRRNLGRQLRAFGLEGFLGRVISGPRDGASKADLVRRSGWPYGTGDFVIGDTELDLRAAAELGLTSVAVSTGIRDEDLLRAENPDFVIDGVKNLPGLLG